MIKRAADGRSMLSILTELATITGGAAAGGYIGRKGLAPTLGYEDDPGALNLGTGLNAINGGLLGSRRGLQFMRKHPYTIAPGIALEETIPVLHRNISAVPRAIKESGANHPGNKVLDFLGKHKGTASGAVAGTAGAGLAAILTGLAREKNQSEMENGSDRSDMVLKDFLTYAAPAAIGGGLLGSYSNKA